MAVYVSLIPKYKFSQAKRFLVKPNAKLCPTSDRVSRLALSTGIFWMAGSWKWWNSPDCLSHAGRHRWAGASLVSLPSPASGCSRSSSPVLSLTCWLALGPAHTPGKVWRWLCVCVMPQSWANNTSVPSSCGAGDVRDGESGASSLPGASGLPLLTTHAPGQGAELMAGWVQSAAFWCCCSSSSWGSCPGF